MQRMRPKSGLDPLEIGAMPLVRGPKSHGNPLSANRRFQPTCYFPKTRKPDLFEFPVHVRRRPRRTKIGSEARSKAI